MMDMIRQAIDPLLQTVGAYVPTVFGALLVFVIGWLIAGMISKLLGKMLHKVKLDERLQGESEKPVKVEKVLSGICYYLLLLYVLLLTLDILGVEGVLAPLANMFDRFLSAFPNIIAALLIGFLGYILAKMLSSVVTMLTQGLDGISSRIGLSESLSISKTLGQLTYIIVLIPIIVAAFDALKIEAISRPASSMLESLLIAVPNILAAAIILIVAFVAGRFVTQFLSEFLKNLGADELPEKMGAKSMLGEKTSFSKLIGYITFFFIMLAAGVSAVEKLAMPQLTGILTNLLVFSGKVALGLIILGIGNFIANAAYRALNRSTENSVYAAIVRIAILALVLAMGLRAMEIADDIINMAFALTLGAVALATALSFGLGGREAAGKQMEYWLSKLRK